MKTCPICASKMWSVYRKEEFYRECSNTSCDYKFSDSKEIMVKLGIRNG